MKHLTHGTIFAITLMAISGWLLWFCMIVIPDPHTICNSILILAALTAMSWYELEELIEKNHNPIQHVRKKKLSDLLMGHGHNIVIDHGKETFGVDDVWLFFGDLRIEYSDNADSWTKLVATGDTLEIKVDDGEWESYRITN